MTRLRAMIWALFALVVGGLAYVIAVGSVIGQRAEESVLDASEFTTNPPAPLSLVSTPSIVVALIVIALIALWVHGIGRTLSILAASVIALVASQLLKETWLERPDLLDFASANTFPSGHMTVFAVVAAGVIWAVPRSAQIVVATVAALVLGAVSWQLLEFGWHRPSDLIGALALTLLSFALLAGIGPRRSKQSRAGMGARKLAGANRAFAAVLSIAGAIVVLGGLALVAAAVWLHSDALMLNAWEIVLIGASVLTARTFARVCP